MSAARILQRRPSVTTESSDGRVPLRFITRTYSGVQPSISAACVGVSNSGGINPCFGRGSLETQLAPFNGRYTPHGIGL
jgi:hypothetical protein